MSTLEHARELDLHDPMARFRRDFIFPQQDGAELIYFTGNSLGLQPKKVRPFIDIELEDWAKMGVKGHFSGRNPWYDYHEFLEAPMARVVGAKPGEVVVMNALTVNLHLMMVSFYRPTPERYKVVVEAGAFPSDRYAVASQARFHGYDPQDAVVELAPRDGEFTLRTEDITAYLSEHGHEVALVMLSGVNYYTGQVFHIEAITQAGHAAGAVVGFDLAHAAGNVRLHLHDHGVDFAVWCTYKYLNSGPGGVAGCFVHERWANEVDLPRFAGWWGNDPASRFEMPKRFIPQPGAPGWQLSNAPVLSMAALRASLELFDAAGMEALREKSEQMTAYMLELIDAIPNERFEIITPRDPAQRGCQLSIRTTFDGRALFDELTDRGVCCDFRTPDVIRVAPAPLYNSFEEVWRFCEIMRETVAG
ncbi:MAG: kynureninase [Myxococcota bacterium]